MNNLIEKTTALRHQLHSVPETAFQENKTREILKSFIEAETGFEVHDHGNWLSVKIPGKTADAPIAFRADCDAVCGANGEAGHYCGHDGHSATLAGTALYFAKQQPVKTVYLIFQPAEEIGEGALVCAPFLKAEGISEIYGYHNIPGHAPGSVLVRRGTFACGSTGLEICMKGKPSHAAYPEFGVNPSAEIAKLILHMNQLLEQPHQGMVLGTVIGVDIGSESYGVSADSGILRLTLRGEYEDEFKALVEEIESCAVTYAEQCGADLTMRRIEPFFATVNSDACTEKVLQAAVSEGLAYEMLTEPFRWSEDFGSYSGYAPGALFGIGDGEEYPQLHTGEFEFPDAILENAIRVFVRIANMA